MFKEIKVHATFNERTGYGIHSSRFFPMLEKVAIERGKGKDKSGEVHISLLDTVTASQTEIRHPYPSILFNVWESTEQPQSFMDHLKLYDQLWVPSEWQRACSIAQGVPEEFVKVVPEGVEPHTYKPIDIFPESDTFNFVHVGQWQHRKSTKEIVQSWLSAFPQKDYPSVRLYLSTDTLFPSDPYHSTEERLTAYGLVDSRIIPVHFEEREDYIRRLQSAHVFVSCSRSEGWGLPIIEAMACGIPTIVADFGGSTEYAGGDSFAIRVNVPKLKKPKEIYGNWDVPGKWGEPDYDDLILKLKDSYHNYEEHKKKALITSETIRIKFSWESAANRAYDVLSELYDSITTGLTVEAINESTMPTLPTTTTEQEIANFARSRGYKILDMKKESAIFVIDCWPSSQEKMNTLVETINQVKALNLPILLASHYPLPAPIIETVDYYVYDREDILSGDDKPIYERTKCDGTLERTQARVEYHGVAALNNIRNAIDFCRGRYDWIYEMTADMEVDLDSWLTKVRSSDKPLILIPYEDVKNGIGGGLLAGRTEVFDQIWPRIPSWQWYADQFIQLKFVTERWLYAYWAKHYPEVLEQIEWIDTETHDRFDNIDRELWEDDDFHCHFVEGPYLNIIGLSRREYDVIYSEGDKTIFTIKQKVGMWSRPSVKYYKNWLVRAYIDGVEKFRHEFNLDGKRVLISLGSKALGDTIAWMPYIEAFRKKHNCHVICSGWWQEIFDYPEIEFVAPGSTVENIYASYDVGCFDDQLDKNVSNWRTVPLQKVASDILGLDYEPLRAKLKVDESLCPHIYPYVCFSEFSTMQNKLWNREGAWQKVVDYLESRNHIPVSISFEPSSLERVTKHNGESIAQTIANIYNCSFYIGLNHGPAWIAYALNKPVIMITGVSEPWNDFPMFKRISVSSCTPGCFNDPSLPIDRGWSWCPRNKDFLCTRDITEEMVYNAIDELILEVGHAGKDNKKGKRKVSGGNSKRHPCEGNNISEGQITGAFA